MSCAKMAMSIDFFEASIAWTSRSSELRPGVRFGEHTTGGSLMPLKSIVSATFAGLTSGFASFA